MTISFFFRSPPDRTQPHRRQSPRNKLLRRLRSTTLAVPGCRRLQARDPSRPQRMCRGGGRSRPQKAGLHPVFRVSSRFEIFEAGGEISRSPASIDVLERSFMGDDEFHARTPSDATNLLVRSTRGHPNATTISSSSPCALMSVNFHRSRLQESSNCGTPGMKASTRRPAVDPVSAPIETSCRRATVAA